MSFLNIKTCFIKCHLFHIDIGEYDVICKIINFAKASTLRFEFVCL